MLEKLLAKPPAGIAIAQTLDMTGEEALAHAAKGGWEGIIAKRNDSMYETAPLEGMAEDQDASTSRSSSSSAGSRATPPTATSARCISPSTTRATLRYAGKVGTGFSAKLRVWLRDELAKDVVAKTTVEGRAARSKTATWVEAAARRAGVVHRMDVRSPSAPSVVPRIARRQRAATW